MTEKRLIEKVELIRFAEVMKRGSLMMMHGMEVPEREPKPDAARALEILER